MKKYIEEFRGILSVKSVKGDKLMLVFIIIFTLFVRLYTIDKPMLDRTLWKEIDHIEISSNYVKNHHKFIEPTISWPAEPPRVTAMELPLVDYLTSFLYPLFGTNPYTVRFITALSFTLLPLALFLLVRLEFGVILGLMSAMFVAFIPLFNSESIILFSEPPLILFSVLAVYFYNLFLEKDKMKYILFASISLSLAVSLKPDALYMLIPLIWLHFRKHGMFWRTYIKPMFGFLLAMIIPFLWYGYAYYLTEHSIDVFGVFQGHNKFQTFAMLKLDLWREIMSERITGSTGGKIGFFLFLAGVVGSLYLKPKNVFLFYLLAMVAFVLVIAEGNADTPYRQTVFSPVISFFMAMSFLLLAYIGYKIIAPFTRFISISFINKVLYIGLFLIAMYFIKGSRTLLRLNWDINRPQHERPWALAQELKKHTNKDSKIITVGAYTIHKGGNDLSPVIYYYSGVQGWSLQKGEWDMNLIDELIHKGADFFVGQAILREEGLEEFVNEIRAEHKVLFEDKENQLIIISLTDN